MLSLSSFSDSLRRSVLDSGRVSRVLASLFPSTSTFSGLGSLLLELWFSSRKTVLSLSSVSFLITSKPSFPSLHLPLRESKNSNKRELTAENPPNGNGDKNNNKAKDNRSKPSTSNEPEKSKLDGNKKPDNTENNKNGQEGNRQNENTSRNRKAHRDNHYQPKTAEQMNKS